MASSLCVTSPSTGILWLLSPSLASHTQSISTSCRFNNLRLSWILCQYHVFLICITKAYSILSHTRKPTVANREVPYHLCLQYLQTNVVKGVFWNSNNTTHQPNLTHDLKRPSLSAPIHFSDLILCHLLSLCLFFQRPRCGSLQSSNKCLNVGICILVDPVSLIT